jgi:hypothetical protein
MRVAVFLLAITTILIPQGLHAQLRRDPEVPRYELGMQTDFSYLAGFGVGGGGIGLRFHYNFAEHFALDSQLTYRQHNVANLVGTSFNTGIVGQTTGLFGVRAGQRVGGCGFFAHARAGFLHFSKDKDIALLTRNTVPAFDAGGTLETYYGPTILRFGLSEMIVPYGNAKGSPGPPVTPLQPPPGRLGTHASPMVSFGFAVRF